jgi:transcription initiation factor IIE alpha subunit
VSTKKTVQEAMLYAGTLAKSASDFGYSNNEQRIMALADEVRSLREQLTQARSMLPAKKRKVHP